MYEVGTKSATLAQYKNTNQINNSKNAASERLVDKCATSVSEASGFIWDDKMCPTAFIW